MNILISSAGRRVALLKAFEHTSEAHFNANHKVFASDANPSLSPACVLAQQSFQLPKASAENYVAELLKICLDHNITIVVPTIDTELNVFAKNRAYFASHGITLIVSDENLVAKSGNKRLTPKIFEECNIQVPKRLDKQAPIFPLFIKPFDGSSSIKTQVIHSQEEISLAQLQDNNLGFWQYIDKQAFDEFTIDAYFDKQSNLICMVPRLRMEVREGEISKGMTLKNHLLEYLKPRLSNVLGARGCVTIQVFKNKISDEVYGIEINPRFGGGYPLSYQAGANFPKMIMDEYIYNRQLEYTEDWKENLLMLRFDDATYTEHFDN